MTRPLLLALSALVAVPLALAACSPLKTFDALVPKDGGGELAQRGIAYGTDPRQALDVYVPKAEGTDRPVVVFVYGGSWSSGTRDGYQFVGRALAAQGFVVVIPDYRLVPQVRFPGFVEDGAAAVRWAQANAGRFGGDGSRIVLMGHSAGAHIAALVATDARYLERAGGSLADLDGAIGYSGVYDFLPLTDDTLKATFGGEQRLWDASQPVNFVDGDEPPFFLVHGRNDRIVWPRNSESLARALRDARVPVEFLLLDDLGHYASAINLARRLDDPVTQSLLTFLRNPPPRGVRAADG